MWKIDYDERAAKELAKLDRQVAKQIKKYLDERIATNENPRRFGKSLNESLTGLWRYRVGDYRIIVEIQDEKIVVLVVSIGHRRKIYGNH